MLNTEGLKHYLMFPFKDADARRKLLTGVSLGIAGFIIPVLPWLALMGYAARIMRGIIDEGRPAEMPSWDDMGDIFVDGARLFAFRLVVTLPFLLLGLLLFGMVMGPSMLMNIDPQNADAYGSILGVSMMIIVPLVAAIFLLSFPLGVVLSAADAQIVIERSFKAGFRVTAWWPIFRENVTGFVLIYLIFSVLGFVISIPVTFAMMTIILICLLPIFFIFYTPYSMFVLYALIGYAYAQGRDALHHAPIEAQ